MVILIDYMCEVCRAPPVTTAFSEGHVCTQCTEQELDVAKMLCGIAGARACSHVGRERNEGCCLKC